MAQRANLRGIDNPQNPYLIMKAPGLIEAEMNFERVGQLRDGIIKAMQMGVSTYSNLKGLEIQESVAAAQIGQANAAAAKLNTERDLLEGQFQSSYNTYLSTVPEGQNPLSYNQYRSNFGVQSQTTVAMNAPSSSQNTTGIPQASSSKGVDVPVNSVANVSTNMIGSGNQIQTMPQFFTPKESQAIATSGTNYTTFGRKHETELLNRLTNKTISQDTNPVAYGVSKSLEQGNKSITVFKGTDAYQRYEFTDFKLDDSGNKIPLEGHEGQFEMETKFVDVKQSLYTQNATTDQIFGTIKPPMTEEYFMAELSKGDNEFKKELQGKIIISDNSVNKIKNKVRTTLLGEGNEGNLKDFTKNFATVHGLDKNFSFDSKEAGGDGNGVVSEDEITQNIVRYANVGKMTPQQAKKTDARIAAEAKAYGDQIYNKLTKGLTSQNQFNPDVSSELVASQVNEAVSTGDVKALSTYGLGDATMTEEGKIRFAKNKTINIDGLRSLKAVKSANPTLTDQQAEDAYSNKGKYTGFVEYDPTSRGDMEKLELAAAEQLYTGQQLTQVKENIIKKYDFAKKIDMALEKINTNEKLSDSFFLKEFDVDSVSKLPTQVRNALIMKKVNNNQITTKAKLLSTFGMKEASSLPDEFLTLYYNLK